MTLGRDIDDFLSSDRMKIQSVSEEQPKYLQKGVKYDTGKTQWWYLPIGPIKLVIDVLEYGDKKYPAEDGCNWKRVPDARKRYYSALMRHITAWWDGEKYDKESGMHHLAHAATNIIFLLWFDLNEDKE